MLIIQAQRARRQTTNKRTGDITVDYEQVAATLAAAMLIPIQYGDRGSAKERAAVLDREAHHAASVYQAVLSELVTQLTTED